MNDEELWRAFDAILAADMGDEDRVRRRIEAVAGLEPHDPPFPRIPPDTAMAVLSLAIRDWDTVSAIRDGHLDPGAN